MKKKTYGLPIPVRAYDSADKDYVIDQHVRYMLSRTQSMFKYEGLPDSIPQNKLEEMLQVNGNVCITQVNGSLYAFIGGLGGEPDPYYRPTLYTVANPALNYSANLKIGAECCVILNDSMYQGLMPLYNRYASAMAENELSMKLVTINTRIASIISASDDRTLKSAEKYIKDLEDGKMAVIGDNAFFDGVRVQPYGTASQTSALITLIEQEQYLKASWYNELGLNANWNGKREALGSNESALNDDMLRPLVDDMLRCRREGLEMVNAMYGTSITVDLNSSWLDNRKELEAEQEILEQQAEPEAEAEVMPDDQTEEVAEDEPAET